MEMILVVNISKYYSKELNKIQQEINDVYKIYHSGDLKRQSIR